MGLLRIPLRSLKCKIAVCFVIFKSKFFVAKSENEKQKVNFLLNIQNMYLNVLASNERIRKRENLNWRFLN